MTFLRHLGRCGLIALVVPFSQPDLAASPGQPTGRAVFRQECAKCHGRNGEGVKGKYDGHLQGERSLEKLTRYIERNMPDDNPGKLPAQDAAAVAGYIYDTYYSREARARSSRPPRVELVRLTNLQYLNSIADLLKEFARDSGAGVPPATRGAHPETGLRATYYNSKGFDHDKKSIERVDQQVDADFGEGRPDPGFSGTNGYSIQWHGSLKAEETGEYEMVLHTPNGTRLWLNDDDEPLIDAWVASGKDSEHKATIRLIGGRSYPLQVKFFKAKEKAAAISLQWKPPRGTQQPIPARSLSPASASPTLVVPTPFPPDDSSLGYERGLSVSKAWDEATTAAAIEVANYVVANLDRLSHSKPPDTNRAARLETFCAAFVTAAFHRPLTESEKSLFVSAQFRKATARVATDVSRRNPSPAGKSAPTDVGGYGPSKRPLEDAVKRVVLLTLKSPRFLYLGLDDTRPDDFEAAARLAYGLWDSLPDGDLRKLATQGQLHTRNQVAEQARRMLGDPRASAKMQAFFHHWLQMDRVENLSKDDQLFPGFTPAIIADLRTSLNLFLEDAMWSEASDYRTLLLADYMFLNHRLADFYGLSTNVAGDFEKVSFDPTQRCGVLTHPYLLAAFSYQKFTSPIHRGVFLTRNIVGRSLKPPPMAMTFKDAEFAPNLTMREKVSQLTRPQACQGCHSVINPLGFSLEQFDAVGRFRTNDHDRPVDVVSDYLTDDGLKVHLAGARDVAEFALASETAQTGFIQQLFHHVVKQPVLAYGPDTLSRLRESFVKSGFNMQKLLVEIVTTSAMHGMDKNLP
jgi:cytochrome c553